MAKHPDQLLFLPPAFLGFSCPHQRKYEQDPASHRSCPQRGRLLLRAALVRAEDWPVGAIVAEPWPVRVMPLKRVVSSTKLRQQAKKQACKRRYKAAHRRKRAA